MQDSTETETGAQHREDSVQGSPAGLECLDCPGDMGSTVGESDTADESEEYVFVPVNADPEELATQWISAAPDATVDVTETR